MNRFLPMLTVGAFLAVVVPVASLSAQASDPVIGTWKLNLAKAKFDPGPPPKSATATYAMAGDTLKVTGEGINAEGKPTTIQYTRRYDGKDYPFTGSQDWDATALERVDAYTVKGTRKRAGKVLQTFTRVVSKDGKVLTLTSKGTNAKGETVHTVAVFDKQ